MLEGLGEVREVAHRGPVRLYVADLTKRPRRPWVEPAGPCVRAFPAPRYLDEPQDTP